MNGIDRSRFSSRCQSNGLPRPPGRVASRGARASNSSRSATLDVERDRAEIGFRLDRQRLHHRQAEALRDRADARGRLLAVKLEQVGLQHVDDAGQQRVVGIDRERDLLGAVFHAAAEVARRVQRHIARARREEHEADHVGAGIERGIERVGRGQAADFDQD